MADPPKQPDGPNWGILVTVVLFAAGHLGGGIWFASRINTRVDYIVQRVDQLAADVREISKSQVSFGVVTALAERMDRALHAHIGDPNLHTKKLSEIESRLTVLRGRIELLERHAGIKPPAERDER